MQPMDHNREPNDPHAGSRRSRYERESNQGSFGDTRDDYDDEFGRDQTPLGKARRAVRIPAIAMIVIGILGVLGMVVAESAFLLVQFNLRRGPIIGFLVFGTVGIMAAAGLFAMLIVAGANMCKLRRRGLALAGAYILTATSLASIYAILFYPFGIWALVLLYNPNIVREFNRPQKPTENPDA